MSETQKYLPGNLPTIEKTKSQNGGSTNLSEGSNEVDQEFKVKKGQKFQFINEQTNDWPQWSVTSKVDDSVKNNQEIIQIVKKDQTLKDLQNDISFMYNRGMSLPLRMQIIQQVQKVEKEKKKKQSFVYGVVDKIKGWFK